MLTKLYLKWCIGLNGFMGEHKETVKKLLEHNAGSTVFNGKGQTALHMACDKGNTHLAILLIDKGADANATNEEGETPLHLTVNLRHHKTIQKLLEKGADVNIQSKSGETALMKASKQRDLDAVKILIETGKTVIDIDRVDNERKSALFYAAEKEHVEILEYLVTKGAKTKDFTEDFCRERVFYPLHKAIAAGNTKLTGFYVKHAEWLINIENESGLSPLLVAALKKDQESVKILIEK